MIAFVIILVLVVLVDPGEALAWGPVTHVTLGNSVLSSAGTLGPYLEGILKSFPADYLYGTIIADMNVGKKFTMFAKLVHNWRVGLDILNSAETDHNKSFAYGYLSHLAADTIAHNFFVPHKMVKNYALKGRSHIYYEVRFDDVMDRELWKEADRIRRDASKRNDEFLDKLLARTLFSFKTNKRIFNSFLTLKKNSRLTNLNARLMRSVARWTPTPSEVERYMEMSLSATMDLLVNMRASRSYSMDPHGKEVLKKAKAIRSDLRTRDKKGELSFEKYREAVDKARDGGLLLNKKPACLRP